MAGRKGIHSDFRAELARVMAAIKDCDKLERQLAELLDGQLVGSLVDRGRKTLPARASNYIRLTEQRLANRHQKHGLIRLLWEIKRSVTERELRVALAELKAETEAAAGAATSAVSAALLTFLQTGGLPLHRPEEVLEPGGYEVLSLEEPGGAPIAVPEPRPPAPPAAGAAWPDGIPEDVRAGDLVSDASGELWVVGEDGCERAGVRVAELFVGHPSGAPPHARLADGRLVLVMEVTE